MLQIAVFLCVLKIACMEPASHLTPANVKQDMVAPLAAFHALMIAGAQTVAVNVSVRMGHPVTHTVGSVGVLGAGEGSSVVRHAHPPSMGRTVLSSVAARMAAPAITYQESVTAHQAGQDLCVRIDVLKESTGKSACRSVAVKMEEPAILPRANATVLQAGLELFVLTGVQLELGVKAVT